MKTRLEMAYINKKEAAFVNDGLLLKWHRAGAPVAEGNGQRYQSETRLLSAHYLLLLLAIFSCADSSEDASSVCE